MFINDVEVATLFSYEQSELENKKYPCGESVTFTFPSRGFNKQRNEMTIVN